MSRVAKRPVQLDKSVDVNLRGRDLTIKGPKGQLSMAVSSEVEIKQDDGALQVSARSRSRTANAYDRISHRRNNRQCSDYRAHLA